MLMLQVPDVEGLLERLLGFLEAEKPHVTAEVVAQITALVRRYPETAEACIAAVSAVSPSVGDPALDGVIMFIFHGFRFCKVWHCAL